MTGVDPDADEISQLQARLERLERRLLRERTARLAAEEIAERGLTELYQRQQQIVLLEQIAKTANAATDPEPAMLEALKSICNSMGWALGHLLYPRVQESGDVRLHSSGVLHISTTAESPGLDTFVQETKRLSLGSGVGLPGRVLSEGGPVWLNDFQDELPAPRLRSATSAGLHGALAFPLLTGTETLGVMEFFSTQTLHRDESVVRLAAQIGALLGRVLERERARAQLLHDSLHDPLTRLANRALFIDRVDQALARSRRDRGQCFAVMFLDLDRFKRVNDSLGHRIGDELIIEAAKRLRNSLRDTDTVTQSGADQSIIARMGGDEFTILVEDIRSGSDAARIAERLVHRFEEPFVIQDQELRVTCSIGVTTSESGYHSVLELLRDADLAMYRAKAAGRGRWELFDEQMRAQAVDRLHREADLRQALVEEQFTLAYQPIVDLDGVLRGFEALLRWQHPERGWVSPLETIELAEEMGLIGELGRWVLRQATRQVAHWQQRFDPSLTISVNLSARQLEDATLPDQVRAALAECPLTPGTLRLELTETTVMRDADRAAAVFSELREASIQFALDDFGTGYSSLLQLRQLPLDTLKLDRSFVSDIDTDAEKRSIANLVVSLAQALEMQVVAEGAETAAEVAELRALNCDFVQGYFFYRPMPPAQIEDLLRELSGH